jgi:hypothetical protein
MGWDMPWYSAAGSLGSLLAPPKRPGRRHVACYLRDGEKVFETYWTTLRGVETMDYSYALMDLTVCGRQEPWEDSPPGWPQQCSYIRTDGGAPDCTLTPGPPPEPAASNSASGTLPLSATERPRHHRFRFRSSSGLVRHGRVRPAGRTAVIASPVSHVRCYGIQGAGSSEEESAR